MAAPPITDADHASDRAVKTRVKAIASDTKAAGDLSVETGLAALLDHLEIPSAHFAGRGSADLRRFMARYPERIASLTLLCPVVLDPRSLAPLAERLLVVTGDRGPGSDRVRAGLSELPEAAVAVLEDYVGHTWADIAAERGDSVGAAMQAFLARPGLPPVQPARSEERRVGKE